MYLVIVVSVLPGYEGMVPWWPALGGLSLKSLVELLGI